MRHKAKILRTEASGAVATTAGAPTIRLDVQAAQVPSITLAPFADEFARLLARRAWADIDRRRGYSLPELLLGAVMTALLMLLAVRGLGMLPR